MEIRTRLLSLICAFCILIAGFGDLLTYAGTQSYTLLASDGNTYRITVTYNDGSGIPENAVLTVSEITKKDSSKRSKAKEPTYQDYVAQSVKLIGGKSAPLARVFDISLVDPATGTEYQPTNDVKVTIELLDDSIENYFRVEVVHFHGENDKAELLDSEVNGESVEFTTDGFSVYVVISHEGGEDVETPRVEFHYINFEFTEVTGRADYYEAKPYQFINKSNENQISQIVTNGETLEMIANPPNKKDEDDNEVSFFYGWYTVDVDRANDDTTAWDEATGTWTGNIVYTWPDPQKVDDEIPVIIDSAANPGSSTFKTGEDITWTVGESTGTATLDESGTAHVYLVPMYSDFYFVNFRMGNKEADDGLRNNLLMRRLVVFGTRTDTTIRIGDVQCPSPDPAHQIFSGWETVKKEGGELVTDAFYSTLDSDGNEINGTYDAAGNEITPNPNSKPGYYITIHKSDDENKKSVDLYPVFAEARWINFVVGLSGNGAAYVPSVYRLTNDDNKGTFITELPTTTRPGYDFGGWYVNAAMPENDILNLNGTYTLELRNELDEVIKTINYTQAIQLTDATGAFVDGVKGKVFWQDDPDTESIKCGTSLPSGKTEEDRLFEITSDGKLYMFKKLDSITASAKWNPKVVTYTVVYWLQNANDDDYTLVTYETFEAVAGDTVKITSSGDNGRILSIDASKDTVHDYTATMQNTDENAKYYIKDLRFIHYRTYDGMDGNTNEGVYINGDGSTVINAYYDRNVYRLRFDIGFARRTSTTGSTPIWSEMTQSETASYPGTVYGIVNGDKVALTADGHGGWTYAGTVDIRNDYDGYRYRTTTGTDMPQFGIVNNSIVELSQRSSLTRSSGYRYQVTTASNNQQGTQYGIFNDAILQIYYKSKSWRQTNDNNGVVYNGTRYLRSNANSVGAVYDGTIYRLANGGFSTAGTGDRYGFDGTYYFPIEDTDTFTYNNGFNYGNGTRYTRVENSDANTSHNLGFVNGAMVSVSKDADGWYYNTQEPSTITYSGKLYGQKIEGGTWTFSVSNTTGPNYQDGDNWDTFLSAHRYDLGTTNPFDLNEYTGYYYTEASGNRYIVFYYELVAKYGEYIMDRYPGSQPARNNGNYVFVGWLAQRDSFYNARLSTSIKGFFETMTDDLILTGGPIPGWNVKNANANPNNYRAITVNENNTITGEYGITQEFRCRYRGKDGYNYLYRIFLADSETMEYPSDPSMKFIITAGNGSNPNLQTPPTFYGYHNVDAKVLNNNGVGRTPDGTYSAYTIPELTAAGISSGMIMEFRLQPNQWQIDYKYGKGSDPEWINKNFGPSNDKNFGQSLSDADLYTDTAIANTPVGHTFAGWYENPDGIGKQFDFNSTMPDGSIILYAVYKPIQFMIKINPNGAEIDHIDHTGASYTKYPTPPIPLNRGEVTYTDDTDHTIVERPADSGYDRSQSTFFFADYGEAVGEYAVSRSYVPISNTAATPYIAGGRHVYAYVNLQKLGEAIDGQWGIPADLRDSLYVDATYGVGQYKNDDPAQGETEIYQLYKFYHDLIDQEYAINRPGYWDCDGAKEFSFAAWKATYVSKNSDGTTQLYRKCNSKENWVFLGWYKDNESMPYNFNEPVKSSFTLTAKWRLDGGYTIWYTPEYYLDNGDLINGSMAAWSDPQQGSDMTYTDGAKTTVYKQPTDLTRNGAPVTDNSLIFRGWRVVSLRHTYAPDGTTIIATEYIPLEDNVFYDPNDEYFVNVEFADSSNIIHMQAVYENTGSSYRRPYVANLTLDANSGFLTPGSTADNEITDELDSDTELVHWDHVGTAMLDASADQIIFGDIQSSVAVHLYKYATTLTEDASGNTLTDATDYFAHTGKYFLIGFDENSARSDYLATYPSDSIIAVTRDDSKTIYAIWEPMVYLTFVNNTEDGTVSFGLTSADNSALEVINVKEGMYERHPLSDYSNITLAPDEKLELAFPKGAEKDIVISGTNTLGVGKALIWNSSVKVDEDGQTYATTTGGQAVVYPHTADGNSHSHTLPTGEVKNTKDFTFTETLISNKEPVTVTFTKRVFNYSMVLYDNWNGDGTGGGYQEYDYAIEEITADANGPKSQLLPKTSTRMAFDFLGWAYTPDATEPVYSATLPADNHWTVPDLSIETGFFHPDYTTLVDGTNVRNLYAVWKDRAEASTVYVYKNVPEPGDQTKDFTFTVNIYGKYTYDAQGQIDEISKSGTFTLKHGQFAKLYSSNNTHEGYIRTEVTIFDADANQIGTTKTITAQAGHQSSNYGSFNNSEHITVTETTDEYYDTTIDRKSQVDNSNYIQIADSSDHETNPLDGVAGNTIQWFTTFAGGSVVFNNIRKTKDIIVEKEYVGNNTNAVIFSFTASYTLNGKTVNKGSFTVTSGTPNTEALKEIPLGAVLTITEATDKNYYQFRRIGTGSEVESTVAAFEVTEDTTVYFKNVLKSYPVKFVKVDQDDVAGRIEAFFELSESLHSLGGGTLYAGPSNHDVFYVSGGSNEPFYAGETYTLKETWVQEDFKGLTGPVTITVGNTEGPDLFTVSDPNVTFSKVGDVWEFRVKNQEIKEVKVIKKLTDPLVTQRTFSFNYRYSFKGEAVSETFTLSTVAGSQAQKILTIPVGATGLTISEDTSLSAGETQTIADTYDTTYQTNSSSVAVQGNAATFGTIESDSDGLSVTFANARKTVKITMKKIVKAEDTSGEFPMVLTLRHGEIPIKNYTVFDNGTTETTDDLVTGNDGIVAPQFTMTHNAQKTIMIPVGASLLIKEALTPEQAAVYAAFMTMPGVDLKLKDGKADEVELIGPTEDKDLRIYNIPCICKVTDDTSLLWFFEEGSDTPDDTSDDIYIPAIYDTIKGAFNDLGKFYVKSGSTYTPYNVITDHHQIKMLVDYEVPNTDVVTVPTGYNITFTTAEKTATDGYPFRSPRPYSGASDVSIENDDYRAVLTRSHGSDLAFFTVSTYNATNNTVFKMRDLIIDGDGKNADLGSSVRGGCITAYKSDVTIENCIIYNFEASVGSAVFTTGNSLTIDNTLFDECISHLPNDGYGGGAVNTTANTLKVSNSHFSDCSAIHQGGAIYHYGARMTSPSNASMDTSGATKRAELTNCVFENCVSRAGGGLEADVGNVSLTNCDFINCHAQDMTYTSGATETTTDGTNGGGLNTYTDKFGTAGTVLTVTGCHFYGCSARAKPSSSTGGGGLHSTHLTNTLTNCAFGYDSTDPTNTTLGCSTPRRGGAAAFSDSGSTATLINCDIQNCSAQDGGGISAIGTLSLQGTTVINQCTSSANGGGIYAEGNTTVKDAAVIEFCQASKGGAIYVTGENGKITVSNDASIFKSHAENTGGGAVFVANNAAVVINGGTISENYIKALTGQNVCGGAIYVDKGTCSIYGGIISDNYTKTDSTGKEAVGGAIYVKGTSTLNIAGGTIQGNHSDTTTNGSYAGAIALDGTGVSATITGGTISGNYAFSYNKDAFGGAIALRNGASLTVSGGSISANYARARVRYYNPSNRYANGGAIAVVDSSTLTFTGGTIQNNYAENTSSDAPTQVRGAGIYLQDSAKIYLSGNPNFGNGNRLVTTLTNATNGGDAYTNPRQDIYIPAYDGDAPYIVITGEIRSPGGSIWVYAPSDNTETKQHYKQEQQFAVIQDGASVPDSSLLVFRDAQDDDTTTGSIRSEFLSGFRSGDPNDLNVYWDIPVKGSRKVILRKVTESHVPIENAVFSICRSKSSGPISVKGVVLENLTSMSSGVFYIGELPYGSYYIQETTVPSGYKVNDTANDCNWYLITVGPSGVTNPLTAETE